MSGTRLKGSFIECCDCYTVCPCWITEKADEGHCTGLYAWVFADNAEIEGTSLKGRVMAAASYHGRRRVTQSVLFLEAGFTEDQRQALTEIFARDAGARYKGLRVLLGDVIALQEAAITAKHMDANWSITIESGGQIVANAAGVDRVIRDRNGPITVHDTALDTKMGVDGSVRVQDMDRLELTVAPLPGEPFVYVGRAGMAGRFDYSK